MMVSLRYGGVDRQEGIDGRLFSARLQYLHFVSNGDTEHLHLQKFYGYHWYETE